LLAGAPAFSQEKSNQEKSAQEKSGPPLPNTQPLTIEGDIASQLVDGVDIFLLREIDQSVARRATFWKRDLSSPAAYDQSIAANRQRLQHILGMRDPRVAPSAPQLIANTRHSSLLATGPGFEIHAIRWDVLGGVHGEGLLLQPTGREAVAQVVAIPDADQTPEQLAGLAPGIPADAQFARKLAEQGCRVIVPVLINRELKPRAPPGRQGGARLTNREYIYRSAFELGRHLIGYEVQKVLAAIDGFSMADVTAEAASAKETAGKKSAAPTIVIGYGEGGGIALYAAALDTRIQAAAVCGYFEPREQLWKQPLDRNVFGLLEQFGDAELAAMVYPRKLVIEAAAYPVVTLPSEGGGPATLVRPTTAAVKVEFERVPTPNPDSQPNRQLIVAEPANASEPFATAATLAALWKLSGIAPATTKPAANSPPSLKPTGSAIDVAQRQQRQLQELDLQNQLVLAESPYVRQAFLSRLDTKTPESYARTVEEYRTIFKNEVVGAFDLPLGAFNARSRQAYETDTWIGHEVALDVWPDVIAYGVLLVPKGIKPGEKRPVVVCQHGLEGRPQDIIRGDHPAYHDFAAKLCERGFITFAPQNLYIFKDRFRTLQRKANPLKKTLFSVIVPQHQQIVNWLKTLAYVDPQRIGFYGLSYGGKSAMRIPPLVPDYCLSICSADFNEWVSKNASTRLPYSYVWTGEYEIFEFDLGSTFNYAEMAALICPRPFMVERGHTDGVASDECVAYEYAKVFHLYSHRLKMADRCEMEVFDGPHTINGKGTFDFLHKHLRWPKP
jgi:dienelactone hydrolase